MYMDIELLLLLLTDLFLEEKFFSMFLVTNRVQM